MIARLYLATHSFVPPTKLFFFSRATRPCRVLVTGSVDLRCVRVRRGISMTGINT